MAMKVIKATAAEKKAFPSMKIDKINRTLVEWSPHGLCYGQVLKANGKRADTVGCFMGALLCGAFPAKTREGRAADYIQQGSENLLGDDEALLKNTYGLSFSQIVKAVDYNDRCLYRVKTYDIPASTAKTILALRKKYEKWLKTKAGQKWNSARLETGRNLEAL